MIRKLFSSAILAGLVAGLLISAVYQFTTVPLILHAESFEDLKGQEKATLGYPEKSLHPTNHYIIVRRMQRFFRVPKCSFFLTLNIFKAFSMKYQRHGRKLIDG